MHHYSSYIGKQVRAVSVADYSTVEGKCLRIRQCVEDYNKGVVGIRYLADIECDECVREGFARTMELINK